MKLSNGLKFLKRGIETCLNGSVAQKRLADRFLKKHNGKFYGLDKETGTIYGVSNPSGKTAKEVFPVVWSSVKGLSCERLRVLSGINR